MENVHIMVVFFLFVSFCFKRKLRTTIVILYQKYTLIGFLKKIGFCTSVSINNYENYIIIIIFLIPDGIIINLSPVYNHKLSTNKHILT